MNNRRALSSIIGSAIFVVLFISAFTVFLFAIDVSSDRFSEQLSASFEETLRAKENISVFTNVNNDEKLFVQVQNNGPETINVLDVFVSEIDAGTSTRYDVNFQDARIAPNGIKQVLENLSTVTLADGNYEIKVVTELGTKQTKNLIVPLSPLVGVISTVPKNLGTGQDVTILLSVTNRGNATVFDVSPVTIPTSMTNPTTAIQGVTVGPTPSTINALEPQENVIFTWKQKIIGAIGTTVTYTNTASGTDSISGDTVQTSSSTDSVEFVPQAVSLLQKVELAFLISSPSGNGNANPIFGLNVMNPTAEDITVSRVIFNAAANISSDVKMFSKAGVCENTEIEPNVANAAWTCPADGVLMWSAAIGSEITVPGRDTVAFITEVDKGTIGANTNDPATMITGTAFTSFGAATELAGSTGILANNGHVAVILGVDDSTNTNTISGAGVFNATSVVGNIRAHPSGDQLDLMFALASMDATAGITTGTFIINVPSGFIVNNQSVSPTDGCDVSSSSTLTKTPFTDGSNQITCTVTNLGTDGSEAVIIKIDTTAPNATADALYVVVALAEGIGEEHSNPAISEAIGPFLEFPIQVLAVP